MGQINKSGNMKLSKRQLDVIDDLFDDTYDEARVMKKDKVSRGIYRKWLKDENFIIPLRLEPYKKLFGIGGLQYIDFIGSWANGLHELLDALNRKNVPVHKENVSINPNWEAYKSRQANKIH